MPPPQPHTLRASTDDMDHSPVRSLGRRVRLVVSDSSDQGKDIMGLEGGDGAEIEDGHRHAGEPATNADHEYTLTGLGIP